MTSNTQPDARLAFYPLATEIDGASYIRVTAIAGNAAVGTVSLELCSGIVRIFSLFVHARFRRDGIGSQLLNWCESYGVEQGCFASYLTCEEENEEAEAFYLRCGMTRTKVRGHASVFTQLLL